MLPVLHLIGKDGELCGFQLYLNKVAAAVLVFQNMDLPRATVAIMKHGSYRIQAAIDAYVFFVFQ